MRVSLTKTYLLSIRYLQKIHFKKFNINLPIILFSSIGRILAELFSQKFVQVFGLQTKFFF